MEFHACNFDQKSHQRSKLQWLYISKWISHGIAIMCVQSFMFYQKVHNSVIFYEYAPLIFQTKLVLKMSELACHSS